MHLLLHLFHFVTALLGARRWAQRGYYLPRYLHVVALCMTGVWAFCLWKLAPPRGYNTSDVPLLLVLLPIAPIAVYAIHIAAGGDAPPHKRKREEADADDQGDKRSYLHLR